MSKLKSKNNSSIIIISFAIGAVVIGLLALGGVFLLSQNKPDTVDELISTALSQEQTELISQISASTSTNDDGITLIEYSSNDEVISELKKAIEDTTVDPSISSDKEKILELITDLENYIVKTEDINEYLVAITPPTDEIDYSSDCQVPNNL